MELTVEKVLNWYEKMKFPLFENNKKDFNMNLFAYRALDCGTDMPNDCAGVLWKDLKGEWQLYYFLITADPGLDGCLKPTKKEGVAIIKHSEYYRGVFALGIHAANNPRYRHMALRQVKDMKYWRDNNLDNIRDYEGKVHVGLYNTNFHSTPEHWIYNPKIRFNSIGCLWAPDNKEFHKTFIPLMQKAEKNWGNSFSLAFFYEGDV